MALEEKHLALEKKHLELEKKHLELEEKHRIVEEKYRLLKEEVDNLEFKAGISPLQDIIGDIVALIEKEFAGEDSVQKVLYAPLDGKDLQITIIHNMDDRIDALDRARQHMLRVGDAFPAVYFEPVLLHVSEVESDHEMGTAPIISR